MTNKQFTGLILCMMGSAMFAVYMVCVFGEFGTGVQRAVVLLIGMCARVLGIVIGTESK